MIRTVTGNRPHLRGWMLAVWISLYSISAGAQSPACTSPLVNFTHMDLTASASQELSLQSCLPDACRNNYQVKKTTVRLVLGLSDTYDWTASTFSSEAKVAVEGYAADDALLFTEEATLTIHENQPEHQYQVDLYQDIRYFRIRPVGYQEDAQIANALQLQASYTVVAPAKGAGFTTGGLSETINGWEATFRWQDNACAAPGYEVQVLRLYDNQAPRWQSALNTLTESNASALTLTLAEGSGTYAWRVRAIGTLEGGITHPDNWGAWSGVRNFTFTQPDDHKNWIYSRTFTEGGRVSERLTFANGLQQVQQQQTRLQEDKQVVTSQTMQDYVGRDALNTLPIPVKGKQTLGYEDQLLLRQGSTNPYTVADFDKGNGQQPTPAQDRTGYYDGQDDGIDTGVADAEGFPYQRTLYHSDGTGRVKEAAGAGATHSVQGGKTMRTYYAGVAQPELTRLFGDEAPQASNTHKIINIDPNNTTSITYQAKDGQVLATALSTGDSSSLEALESQAGAVQTITETVTDLGMFGTTGSSSRKPLFFTSPAQLKIDYRLTPASIEEACTQLCQSCDYRVQILLHDQEDATRTRTVVDHTVPAGSCGNANAWTPGPVTVDVSEGSYVLEKRVESYQRDASGTAYLETYLRDVLDTYDAELDSDLASITAFLDNQDTEGLYQHLASRYGPVQTDGEEQYYLVPVACGEEIRIPLLTEACQEDELDPAKLDFEAYFNQVWNGKYNLIEALRTEWVPDVWIDFEPDQFNQMIRNMVDDDDYDAQMLWNAWKQQVHGYESLQEFEGTSALLDDQTTLVYQHQMLETFLQGVTGYLEENRQVTDIDDPGYDQYEPNTFIRKTVDTNQLPLNPTTIYKTVYYDLSVPLMRNCWDNFLRGGNSFSDLNDAEKYQLYYCLKYADTEGETPTEATMERKRTLVINRCGKACEDRSEAFRQAVINDLLQKDKNTRIENYQVSYSDWTEQYTGIRTERVHTDDYTIAECEIDAMVASLVAHCKTYCDISLVRNDEGIITQLGTPEEIANMQKAMTYNFEVQESNGSCTTDFEEVTVNSDAVIGGGKTPEDYLQERLDAFEFGAIATVSNLADFDTVWTVTKTIDPDPFNYETQKDDPNSEMYGTLQWAMRKANETPGSDLMQFNIVGESPTITLNNKLPPIYSQITIDGFSQLSDNAITIPGVKILQSSKTSSVFNIYGAKYSEIKGLEIQTLEQGSSIIVSTANNVKIINNILIGPASTYIHLKTSYNSVVQGNILGADIHFQKFRNTINNQSIGITTYGANNVIGGNMSNQGNIIFADIYGIDLSSHVVVLPHSNFVSNSSCG